MMPFLILIGYAAAVAAVTALLHALRPAWGRWSIVSLVAYPVPVATILVTLYFIGGVGRAAPGETDASGMAIAVYMISGLMTAGAALLIGLAASLVTLRWFRKPRS
ncbi:hypothetical protein [Sphingomonas sp.]|uniref:hypothetical protein n=1 Tax=Sphingomonas sp. TaxID=28214 RepID=UPI003B3A5C90